MPGPFRSLWAGSKSLQGPVPGLVLEVQVGFTMSVRPQIIENGPNQVQNRQFGLKILPEVCQNHSEAFQTGPVAKESKDNLAEPPQANNSKASRL